MKKIISVLFAIFAFTMPAIACESNEIDTGSACVESKFEITTVNMEANTNFVFFMSAAGIFYVDWGDGKTDVIDRTNNTNKEQYTHEYVIGGVRTIRFGGRATKYNTSEPLSVIAFSFESEDKRNCETAQLIASVDGRLSDIFPDILGKSPRFMGAFYCAKNLHAVPDDLFRGLTGCRGSMFVDTFNGSGLTSVPGNLFADINCPGNDMFRSTFYGTPITKIPEGLFRNITDVAERMFFMTFANCTNLSGYIPPSAFAGLITNGSPTAYNMFYDMFKSTNLATSCPDGTIEFNTGYKGSSASSDLSKWGYYVSCYDPTPQNCSAGEYLPRYYNTCVECLENNMCAGGNYSFNASVNQGIEPCATGYSSVEGASSCTPNTITIIWDNASQSDIAVNNAGTVTYGGDIRTPRKAQHINGKIFVGWSFNNPE